MSKAKVQTFEASMERLEQIVHLLEDGSVSLEEAMKLFQEGTALAASCGKLLDQAELEVLKLTRDSNGRIEEVPFAHEDAE